MATTSERFRLLVVDDDPADRQMICRALTGSALDATCDEVSDAAEAMRLALSQPYDCLLVDQDLPSTSGVQLARELRTANVHTPVVLLTRRAEDDLEQITAEFGITDYMPKSDAATSRLARRIRFAIRVGRAERATATALDAATLAAHARDDVLAVVSHDLRGPLHAISLACEALRDDLVTPASIRYLGAIERASARAERLISDLLEASAIENGALTLSVHPTDAASVIRQAATDNELTAAESGGRIMVEIPTAPIMVMADRDRVMQVLGNLLGNAFKHARGTPVTITLQRRELDALIEVRDQGPGIRPVELPHVFDRYWRGRTRKAGAGLGLAIVKGIITAHGGTIEVLSEPGRGAAFRFTLPLSRSPS